MDPLTCALLAALLAGGSPAGKSMETTVQDDAAFLHGPPARVRSDARRLAALGADRLRVTAGWSELAPSPRSRTRPDAPFDARDSRTYAQGPWKQLDHAVRSARSAGLDVMIDIAFWAPRWAVKRSSPRPGGQRYDPSPQEFGAFAEAVARRYNGRFRTRRSGPPLPAVRMFTTWNESNDPAFLLPQWRRDRRTGKKRPVSPHLYRRMHEAAYDAIKPVQPGSTVLIGGTASDSSKGRGVAPLRFVREMACVDRTLRPLRDEPACRNFQPLRADGFAHHPYSRATDPGASDPEPDDVPIGNLARLETLLDQLTARGRFVTRPPLYLTEYAYETGPPDPFQPFSPEDQARFMGWSTHLAWSSPTVRMFSQFLLRDLDPRETGARPGSRDYWRDWQSGLLFADGTPKPAAQAFKLPFWARLAQTSTGVPAVLTFGQVRVGGSGVKRVPQVVRVERRGADGVWTPVAGVGRTSCGDGAAEFLTDGEGFFERALPAGAPGDVYRLAWRTPGGRWDAGTEVQPVDQLPTAGR
jgi:hypothetical protein